MGDMEVPFGKYNGLKLSEVPRSYLDWALSVESASHAMRELSGEYSQFLGNARSSTANPICDDIIDVAVTLSDPLSREFLAIVRNA